MDKSTVQPLRGFEVAAPGALGLPEICGKWRAMFAELAASPVIQRNELLKTGLAVRRR